MTALPLTSIAFSLTAPSPPIQLSTSVRLKLYCSHRRYQPSTFTVLRLDQANYTHISGYTCVRNLLLIVGTDIESVAPLGSVVRCVTGSILLGCPLIRCSVRDHPCSGRGRSSAEQSYKPLLKIHSSKIEEPTDC